jgi:hypothetical protein
MPALLAPAYAAVQLAHALASPRKVLVIHSHTNTLTGNALGLALAAQSSPDFLPVFLGQRSAPLGFEIPTWRSNGRIARLVRQRADIVAFTGYVRSKRVGSAHSLRLFLWHGMPIKGIGKFDPFTADRVSEPCDLAIATSQHTLGIMSQSFGIAPEKFVISGEPKTDEIPTDRPGWAWCASLRQQYRTIIGYFPTWREAVAKIDGRLRRRNDDSALGQLIGQLTADQALRHLLERHRAAMVIRVHSLSVGKLPPPSPPFFSMNEAQGEATHLLQECDVVVGDYSAIIQVW